MRRIINGKMYSTDTAKFVASCENMLDTGNWRYCCETLYIKKNGEWFLHGEGHGLSAYATVQGNMRGWGERIIPYTDAEAREWVETYCDVDTYIRYFGEPEE